LPKNELVRNIWRGKGYKVYGTVYTDKKGTKIFLIYKEIQMGSGAKAYMRKLPNI
jgi:hypothetical protein